MLRTRSILCLGAAIHFLGTASPGLAQDAGDAEAEVMRRFQAIAWEQGPTAGTLGEEATVQVPESCTFTGGLGTREFMELNQNPTDGDERGTVLCPGPSEDDGMWFVVFTYRDGGYVKDDERNSINAAKLLESLRASNAAGNRERARRGWETLTLDGWAREPYYDARTNNLTWALRAINGSGDTTINHSVRLLGRGGVMEVDLVADPSLMLHAVPAFDAMLGEFQYVPGKRYAEWRSGDRVAEYGLTALVAGGAGAVAAKSGLLAKLGKVLIAAAVAVLAGLKSIAGRLFGRKGDSVA